MKTIEKLLTPALEHNERIRTMSNKEKIKYIKDKYNLHHGKGKSKKNNKNHR